MSKYLVWDPDRNMSLILVPDNNTVQFVEGPGQTLLVKTTAPPGTGIPTRLAEWGTTNSIQASTLVKAGVGVLTFTATGDLTLTASAAGSIVVGSGTANQVVYWTGVNSVSSNAELQYSPGSFFAVVGVPSLFSASAAVASFVITNTTATGLATGFNFFRRTTGGGSPGANYGLDIALNLHNASNADSQAMLLRTQWLVATAGSEISVLRVFAKSTGVVTEAVRFQGTAGLPNIGMAGVTAFGSSAAGVFAKGNGTAPTTNITGTQDWSESNGWKWMKSGVAVAMSVPGVLSGNITDVGNVGTGEDDLMTYSVTGSTLSADRDSIEFENAVVFASNGNNKQVKAYFGATQLYASGAQAQNGGSMVIKVRVVRTGAATQDVYVTVTNSSGSLFANVCTFTQPTETLSGAVTFKLTGEATSNDDIVQKILLPRLNPQPS